jgi:hypothetical protein
MTNSLGLSRNAQGRLCATDTQGVLHEGVTPVRAYPISAPLEGLSLVSREGHEVRWITHLDELNAADRTLIESELAGREFMPVIEALVSVSSFATPSTWHVSTNRGETRFVLRGEEDIRRLDKGALLIADSHGIQFMVSDIETLDRHSRRLLDRFL